eukprot:3023322-Prymnesium_polylepis.1
MSAWRVSVGQELVDSAASAPPLFAPGPAVTAGFNLVASGPSSSGWTTELSPRRGQLYAVPARAEDGE